MTSLRSKSNANSEFVGALHDGVGDNAEEADSRQRKCQACECAEEPCDELPTGPLRCPGDPMLQVAYVPICLLVMVDRVYLLPYCVQKRQWRDFRSHQDLGVHAHRKGERRKGLRKD